tara:strand:- start:233 stop:628 length:396 start_codon:yes stop_codon:yes gene_type:complete
MIKYQFNKLINQNISITSKFPTGSGKFKFLNKNKIEVKTIEDPITSKYTIGYDYYFHFLITNYSNKIKELEFLILRKNSKNIINWKASKAPLFYSNDSIKWYLINNMKASKNHKEYSFKIKIKQKRKMYKL